LSVREESKMKVRMGFVGPGYIGKVHGRAASRHEDVEMSAVVGRSSTAMDQFVTDYGTMRRYDSVEDMLAEHSVDAVVIATPNYLHAPQTIAALEAGIHVMVEKPMAINTAEAEAMAEASRRSGALLMVAHCWRFDVEILWLRQQALSGHLGKIIRTKGYGVHTNWGPNGWFAEKRMAGGGALADMGVHAIDTVRFLIGDPQPISVYARIGTYYKDFDVDDTGVLLVNWDNGVTSYIESGWWQPHVDGPEASTQLYGTLGFGQTFPTYLDVPDHDKGIIEGVDPQFPPRAEHCPQEMYDKQMAYFVDCIVQGREPVPGAEEGVTNTRIVDAAYESATIGEVVHLS
jgi:predicted dehydrogenase